MARVSYPVSNYFTLDRIDEDQAQDYAKRKGWDDFLTLSKIYIDLVSLFV